MGVRFFDSLGGGRGGGGGGVHAVIRSSQNFSKGIEVGIAEDAAWRLITEERNFGNKASVTLQGENSESNINIAFPHDYIDASDANDWNVRVIEGLLQTGQQLVNATFRLYTDYEQSKGIEFTIVDPEGAEGSLWHFSVNLTAGQSEVFEFYESYELTASLTLGTTKVGDLLEFGNHYETQTFGGADADDVIPTTMTRSRLTGSSSLAAPFSGGVDSALSTTAENSSTFAKFVGGDNDGKGIKITRASQGDFQGSLGNNQTPIVFLDAESDQTDSVLIKNRNPNSPTMIDVCIKRDLDGSTTGTTLQDLVDELDGQVLAEGYNHEGADIYFDVEFVGGADGSEELDDHWLIGDSNRLIFRGGFDIGQQTSGDDLDIFLNEEAKRLEIIADANISLDDIYASLVDFEYPAKDGSVKTLGSECITLTGMGDDSLSESTFFAGEVGEYTDHALTGGETQEERVAEWNKDDLTLTVHYNSEFDTLNEILETILKVRKIETAALIYETEGDDLPEDPGFTRIFRGINSDGMGGGGVHAALYQDGNTARGLEIGLDQDASWTLLTEDREVGTKSSVSLTGSDPNTSLDFAFPHEFMPAEDVNGWTFRLITGDPGAGVVEAHAKVRFYCDKAQSKGVEYTIAAVGSGGNDWDIVIEDVDPANPPDKFIDVDGNLKTLTLRPEPGVSNLSIFKETGSTLITAEYFGGVEDHNVIEDELTNEDMVGDADGIVDFSGGLDNENAVDEVQASLIYTFESGPDAGKGIRVTYLSGGASNNGNAIRFIRSNNKQPGIGPTRMNFRFVNGRTSLANIYSELRASTSPATADYIGEADGSEILNDHWPSVSSATDNSEDGIFAGGVDQVNSHARDPMTLVVDSINERVDLTLTGEDTFDDLRDLALETNYNSEAKFTSDDIVTDGDGNETFSSYVSDTIGEISEETFSGGVNREPILATYDDINKEVKIRYDKDADTIEDVLNEVTSQVGEDVAIVAIYDTDVTKHPEPPGFRRGFRGIRSPQVGSAHAVIQDAADDEFGIEIAIDGDASWELVLQDRRVDPVLPSAKVEGSDSADYIEVDIPTDLTRPSLGNGWHLRVVQGVEPVAEVLPFATLDGESGSSLQVQLPSTLVKPEDGNDWGVRVIRAQHYIQGVAATLTVDGATVDDYIELDLPEDYVLPSTGGDWDVRVIEGHPGADAVLPQTQVTGVTAANVLTLQLPEDLVSPADVNATTPWNLVTTAGDAGGGTVARQASVKLYTDIAQTKGIEIFVKDTGEDTRGPNGNDWVLYFIFITSGDVELTTNGPNEFLNLRVYQTTLLSTIHTAFNNSNIDAEYFGDAVGTETFESGITVNQVLGGSTSPIDFTGGAYHVPISAEVKSSVDLTFQSGTNAGRGIKVTNSGPVTGSAGFGDYDNLGDSTWTMRILFSSGATAITTSSHLYNNGGGHSIRIPEDGSATLSDLKSKIEEITGDNSSTTYTVTYITPDGETVDTKDIAANIDIVRSEFISGNQAFSGGVDEIPARARDPLEAELDVSNRRISLTAISTDTLSDISTELQRLSYTSTSDASSKTFGSDHVSVAGSDSDTIRTTDLGESLQFSNGTNAIETDEFGVDIVADSNRVDITILTTTTLSDIETEWQSLSYTSTRDGSSKTFGSSHTYLEGSGTATLAATYLAGSPSDFTTIPFISGTDPFEQDDAEARISYAEKFIYLLAAIDHSIDDLATVIEDLSFEDDDGTSHTFGSSHVTVTNGSNSLLESDFATDIGDTHDEDFSGGVNPVERDPLSAVIDFFSELIILTLNEDDTISEIETALIAASYTDDEDVVQTLGSTNVDTGTDDTVTLDSTTYFGGNEGDHVDVDFSGGLDSEPLLATLDSNTKQLTVMYDSEVDKLDEIEEAINKTDALAALIKGTDESDPTDPDKSKPESPVNDKGNSKTRTFRGIGDAMGGSGMGKSNFTELDDTADNLGDVGQLVTVTDVSGEKKLGFTDKQTVPEEVIASTATRSTNDFTADFSTNPSKFNGLVVFIVFPSDAATHGADPRFKLHADDTFADIVDLNNQNLEAAQIRNSSNGVLVWSASSTNWIMLNPTITSAMLSDSSPSTTQFGLMSPGDVVNLISTEIDNLIGGAGDAYDTLKELADEITSNDSAIGTIMSSLTGKLDTNLSNVGTVSPSDQSDFRDAIGAASAATALTSVATSSPISGDGTSSDTDDVITIREGALDLTHLHNDAKWWRGNWAASIEYKAGQAVLRTVALSSTPQLFVCLQDHTSTSSNGPGTSGGANLWAMLRIGSNIPTPSSSFYYTPGTIISDSGPNTYICRRATSDNPSQLSPNWFYMPRGGVLIQASTSLAHYNSGTLVIVEEDIYYCHQSTHSNSGSQVTASDIPSSDRFTLLSSHLITRASAQDKTSEAAGLIDGELLYDAITAHKSYTHAIPQYSRLPSSFSGEVIYLTNDHSLGTRSDITLTIAAGTDYVGYSDGVTIQTLGSSSPDSGPIAAVYGTGTTSSYSIQYIGSLNEDLIENIDSVRIAGTAYSLGSIDYRDGLAIKEVQSNPTGLSAATITFNVQFSDDDTWYFVSSPTSTDGAGLYKWNDTDSEYELIDVAATVDPLTRTQAQDKDDEDNEGTVSGRLIYESLTANRRYALSIPEFAKLPSSFEGNIIYLTDEYSIGATRPTDQSDDLLVTIGDDDGLAGFSSGAALPSFGSASGHKALDAVYGSGTSSSYGINYVGSVNEDLIDKIDNVIIDGNSYSLGTKEYRDGMSVRPITGGPINSTNSTIRINLQFESDDNWYYNDASTSSEDPGIYIWDSSSYMTLQESSGESASRLSQSQAESDSSSNFGQVSGQLLHASSISNRQFVHSIAEFAKLPTSFEGNIIYLTDDYTEGVARPTDQSDDFSFTPAADGSLVGYSTGRGSLNAFGTNPSESSRALDAIYGSGTTSSFSLEYVGSVNSHFIDSIDNVVIEGTTYALGTKTTRNGMTVKPITNGPTGLSATTVNVNVQFIDGDTWYYNDKSTVDDEAGLYEWDGSSYTSLNVDIHELEKDEVESGTSEVFGQISGQRIKEAIDTHAPQLTKAQAVDEADSTNYGQISGELLYVSSVSHRRTIHSIPELSKLPSSFIGSVVYLTDDYTEGAARASDQSDDLTVTRAVSGSIVGYSSGRSDLSSLGSVPDNEAKALDAVYGTGTASSYSLTHIGSINTHFIDSVDNVIINGTAYALGDKTYEHGMTVKPITNGPTGLSSSTFNINVQFVTDDVWYYNDGSTTDQEAGLYIWSTDSYVTIQEASDSGATRLTKAQATSGSSTDFGQVSGELLYVSSIAHRRTVHSVPELVKLPSSFEGNLVYLTDKYTEGAARATDQSDDLTLTPAADGTTFGFSSGRGDLDAFGTGPTNVEERRALDAVYGTGDSTSYSLTHVGSINSHFIDSIDNVVINGTTYALGTKTYENGMTVKPITSGPSGLSAATINVNFQFITDDVWYYNDGSTVDNEAGLYVWDADNDTYITLSSSYELDQSDIIDGTSEKFGLVSGEIIKDAIDEHAPRLTDDKAIDATDETFGQVSGDQLEKAINAHTPDALTDAEIRDKTSTEEGYVEGSSIFHALTAHKGFLHSIHQVALIPSSDIGKFIYLPYQYYRDDSPVREDVEITVGSSGTDVGFARGNEVHSSFGSAGTGLEPIEYLVGTGTTSSYSITTIASQLEDFIDEATAVWIEATSGTVTKYDLGAKQYGQGVYYKEITSPPTGMSLTAFDFNVELDSQPYLQTADSATFYNSGFYYFDGDAATGEYRHLQLNYTGQPDDSSPQVTETEYREDLISLTLWRKSENEPSDPTADWWSTDNGLASDLDGWNYTRSDADDLVAGDHPMWKAYDHVSIDEDGNLSYNGWSVERELDITSTGGDINVVLPDGTSKTVVIDKFSSDTIDHESSIKKVARLPVSTDDDFGDDGNSVYYLPYDRSVDDDGDAEDLTITIEDGSLNIDFDDLDSGTEIRGWSIGTAIADEFGSYNSESPGDLKPIFGIFGEVQSDDSVDILYVLSDIKDLMDRSNRLKINDGTDDHVVPFTGNSTLHSGLYYKKLRSAISLDSTVTSINVNFNGGDYISRPDGEVTSMSFNDDKLYYLIGNEIKVTNTDGETQLSQEVTLPTLSNDEEYTSLTVTDTRFIMGTKQTTPSTELRVRFYDKSGVHQSSEDITNDTDNNGHSIISAVVPLTDGVLVVNGEGSVTETASYYDYDGTYDSTKSFDPAGNAGSWKDVVVDESDDRVIFFRGKSTSLSDFLTTETDGSYVYGGTFDIADDDPAFDLIAIDPDNDIIYGIDKSDGKFRVEKNNMTFYDIGGGITSINISRVSDDEWHYQNEDYVNESGLYHYTGSGDFPYLRLGDPLPTAIFYALGQTSASDTLQERESSDFHSDFYRLEWGTDSSSKPNKVYSRGDSVVSVNSSDDSNADKILGDSGETEVPENTVITIGQGDWLVKFRGVFGQSNNPDFSIWMVEVKDSADDVVTLVQPSGRNSIVNNPISSTDNEIGTSIDFETRLSLTSSSKFTFIAGTFEDIDDSDVGDVRRSMSYTLECELVKP